MGSIGLVQEKTKIDNAKVNVKHESNCGNSV